MIRSFVAIPLPDGTADALMDLQTGVRNARWIADDMFHITLAFLDTCTPSELTELDAGLAEMRFDKFILQPQGVGAFGGAKPRQLYCRFEANEALRRLHTKIERIATEVGIYIERRKYIPHITLGRCGGGVIPSQAIDWTIRNARWSQPSFEVAHFGLYRSDLGTGAPIYTEMARYELI